MKLYYQYPDTDIKVMQSYSSSAEYTYSVVMGSNTITDGTEEYCMRIGNLLASGYKTLTKKPGKHICHDPRGISSDGVPDAVVGVSLVTDLPITNTVSVRALAWAMRPSQLQVELLALRMGAGLVHRGLIWAGVSYDNVADDYSLNGTKAAEDNLVSYLTQNSNKIIGKDSDDRTWYALVKALLGVGIHQHPYN